MIQSHECCICQQLYLMRCAPNYTRDKRVNVSYSVRVLNVLIESIRNGYDLDKFKRAFLFVQLPNSSVELTTSALSVLFGQMPSTLQKEIVVF